ncbi:hypothetical protein HDV04_003609 [Boothiomyces sp. JEL0838]|nr:hypothetical protein HDV04_003609 [Boothiomyces sp. JEL0838]
MEDETKIPVPSQDIEEFKSVLGFARASYCFEGLIDWNCTTCHPELQTTDIYPVGNFDDNAFGFVAYSKPIESIVLSFRGTRNFKNWISDLRFAKPDCPFPEAPDNAKVHLGFLETWQFLKADVLDALMTLYKKYPGSKLLLTGHSLGGAVATLASADLYSSFPELVFREWRLITVGQPRYGRSNFRVGNQEFSLWFEGFPFTMHRIM